MPYLFPLSRKSGLETAIHFHFIPKLAATPVVKI